MYINIKLSKEDEDLFGEAKNKHGILSNAEFARYIIRKFLTQGQDKKTSVRRCADTIDIEELIRTVKNEV